MAAGAGKYDSIATAAREQAQAEGVILIIVGGIHGPGFSAQLSAHDLQVMPAILRAIADDIEAGKE